MNRRNLFRLLSCGLLALGMNAGFTVGAYAAEQIKVVYHMVDGIDQATRGLSNIRNHLRAEPDTKIVVVANNDGIRFLLAGTKDRNGKPFDTAVTALAAQGVEFRVCKNTLTAHEVPLTQLLPEAKLVQSGVVEVARLQAKEGFAYLRP
jgi:intracellular sulfur oxidation DsrE/DsrF family protein